MRSGSKELNAALPDGYTLEAGSKHLYVIDPLGERVRETNGMPLTIPKGGKPHSGSLKKLLSRLAKIEVK